MSWYVTLSDEFYETLRAEWKSATPLQINTEVVESAPALSAQKFKYHGCADRDAAECIADIFQGRLKKYDAAPSYAHVACTKRPSAACGLPHPGYCAYECVFSVY